MGSNAREDSADRCSACGDRLLDWDEVEIRRCGVKDKEDSRTDCFNFRIILFSEMKLPIPIEKMSR